LKNKHAPTYLVVLAILIGWLAGLAPSVNAQSHLTLPWEGGNQKAHVSQWMGLVKISITYFSPDVTGPNGEERQGKIWGELIPYNEGNPYPWRAGANHNTTISFSHDVEIEGQPLAAGTYGLHMVPSATDWTIIFSNNSTSWGSFTYDPQEDALRVQVMSENGPYREWLTYDFTNRNEDQTTANLRWENKVVPVRITTNVKQHHLEQIRLELRDEAGFTWQAWHEAAQYCLHQKINYEEALRWVNRSISGDYFSNENATNLFTKAGLLEAMGRATEAQTTVERALELGTADQLYTYGRKLIKEDNGQQALKVFKLNYKRHGDAWPVHLGLGRVYSFLGDHKNARKHLNKALAAAPNNRQRLNISKMLEHL